MIKKETGKTAQEFIQNKIIDVAKERIFHVDKSIGQIAYELGLSIHSILLGSSSKEPVSLPMNTEV